MKMKKVLFLLMIVIMVSCNTNQRPADQEVSTSLFTVATVNYPMYYFAERIGGDSIHLELPIPSDVDPEYWTPDDEALESFQNADLIFAVGADYAKWMHGIKLPIKNVINTSRRLSKYYIELDPADNQNRSNNQLPSKIASYTWLDLELCAGHCEAIMIGLSERMPEGRGLFEQNFSKFRHELGVLDKKLIELCSEFEGETMIATNSIYQYFARRYNINIEYFQIDPDLLPTEEKWNQFSELVNQHSVERIIWDKEPITEIKIKIEEMGLKVIVYDPCSNKPQEADFMSVMNKNIENLIHSLH